MGMFGFAAPQPGAVAPGMYDPSQATGQDKLMLLGAMLKDTGAGLRGGDSQDVMQLQQMLAGRQMLRARQAYLQGMMGSGAPGAGGGAAGAGATGAGGSPLSPAQVAYAKNMLGLDMSDALKAQELARPEMVVGPDNIGRNKFDQSQWQGPMVGVDKGQLAVPLPGGGEGVVNAPGALQAAAASAGAVSGAQESGKAPWTLVDVPQSDGTTIKVPLSVAAPALAARMQGGGGAGGAAPGMGGAGGLQDGAPQFGVTQSPAAAELAKARAATQGQREQLQPKEEGALRDLDTASKLTSDTIHQILGDARDPKTGQWVVGSGKSMIHPWTVGMGANLANIKGTPAHDLDELLEHVNAATSMANLQNLRDNSPTGAGLGRVTQQEIQLLAAMNGSTDQGQRGPQFQQNLRRQLSQLDAAVANRKKVYASTYGNLQQQQPMGQQSSARAPASAPSRDALMAEARRRGLIK